MIDQQHEALIKIVKFIKTIDLVYMRPFPPLGTLVSILANEIFQQGSIDRLAPIQQILIQLTKDVFFGHEIALPELISSASNNNLGQAIPWLEMKKSGCEEKDLTPLLNSYTKDLKPTINSCLNNSSPCCHMFDYISINEHLETFINILKNSIMYNEISLSSHVQTMENNYFVANFVNKSKIWMKHNLTYTAAEQTSLGIFLFCDLISSLKEASSETLGCEKFKPVLTSNGLCYSFNSLPFNQIFKDSRYQTNWESAFKPTPQSNLLYPAKWGTPKYLYILLQSYETYSIRKSNEFSISFSDELNAFDVNKNSFELLPGYIHMFRLIPSQIGTTKEFDLMSPTNRKCFLPSENSQSKIFKQYTKARCEYECAIEKATLNCGCRPWSFPDVLNNNTKICELIGNSCFFATFNSPNTYNTCNCIANCESTTLTTSDSIRSITEWQDLCDNNKVIFNYVNFTMSKYKLNFFFKHLVSGEALPFNEMCEYLMKHHVTIVKVEIGTTSVVRSLRDSKTTFENQLSILGK